VVAAVSVDRTRTRQLRKKTAAGVAGVTGVVPMDLAAAASPPSYAGS